MPTIVDNTGKVVKGAYVGPDGHARLSDGKPIPAGFHVQTDDGKMWTMGTDGVGRLNYGNITQSDDTQRSLPAARLYTAEEMGKLMGIDTDVSNLVDKYVGAAEAKYDKLDEDYKKLEGKFGDNMATAQNMAIDAIRKQRSDAIQEGYSSAKEMSAILSGIMGTSQAGAQGATEIAQSGAALSDRRASDVAQAKLDAEVEAQRRKEEIGKLIYQLNSNDVQRMSVDANLIGTLDANKAGLMAQQIAANVQKEVAQIGASASAAALRNSGYTGPTTGPAATDLLGDYLKKLGPNAALLFEGQFISGFEVSPEQWEAAKKADAALLKPKSVTTAPVQKTSPATRSFWDWLDDAKQNRDGPNKQ